MLKFSLLSTHYCQDSKTALKNKVYMAGGVAQGVKHPPSKCNAEFKFQ
jgi:hypothetical protein